jgi:hypothetical protein
MFERLVGGILVTVVVVSLVGLCTAVIGLVMGNLRVADVGMLLASPCYLFMAFLFCGMVWAAYSMHKADVATRRIEALLAHGPRLGVLGNTEFRHADSERICTEVGRLLAGIPDLVLLIGGSEGTGEAIGRSFFQARRDAGQEPRVDHLVPEGKPTPDYGETHFTSTDMWQWRWIFRKLSGSLVLIVEGDLQAEHQPGQGEPGLAFDRIPVGRYEDDPSTPYERFRCPSAIDAATWAALRSSESTPEVTAQAVFRAVSLAVKPMG